MSESSDIQAAGQHYLVCGTEDCKKNGQFYCNACHQPMCEQCRDQHLNNPKTRIHEIVPYRQRKLQLPIEKCELHPTRNVDVFCEDCKIPLCLKCFKTKEHKGHEFDDLEEIYAEKYALWQSEFSKIQKYFLPTSQDLKRDIGEDATEIKNIMESIRTSMKSEAKSLKNLVDDVTSENIEHTHTMEKSLLEMLTSQERTYDEYIAYLEKMSEEFQEYLSLTSRKLLFLEVLKIKTIPETTKTIPPVFTPGQFKKDDVAKLLGSVPNTEAEKREIKPMESVSNPKLLGSVPNTEPYKREIKPIESVSNPMKFTEKQLEQSKEKSGMKQTLSLSSSVTKVREYTLPGVRYAFHVSVDKSGRLWVNDHKGNLVQTDLQGKLLQNIQTSGGSGYHTATQDGGLLYTDTENKRIYRITPEKKITEFIKTRDWKPMSIYSSRINGDILVGMWKVRQVEMWREVRNHEEAKVTKFNMAGQEIQNIQTDNNGQKLYSLPLYITEYINGDICTSDYNKNAVVVVNKSGQPRFSYTGQGSEFHLWGYSRWSRRVFSPHGICTDILGHIMVCDSTCNTSTVHLLNQDGRLLSIILSPQQGVAYSCGLCVDDENNLYVGQYDTNTVTVYKYLQ